MTTKVRLPGLMMLGEVGSEGFFSSEANNTRVSTSAETLTTVALRSLLGPSVFQVCEPESDREFGAGRMSRK
jgi:hypothetical protein